MRIVLRHVLRAGIGVTLALLTTATAAAAETPDLWGSLDDRRLREPLLLLSVYDRVPVQP